MEFVRNYYRLLQDYYKASTISPARAAADHVVYIRVSDAAEIASWYVNNGADHSYGYSPNEQWCSIGPMKISTGSGCLFPYLSGVGGGDLGVSLDGVKFQVAPVEHPSVYCISRQIIYDHVNGLRFTWGQKIRP